MSDVNEAAAGSIVPSDEEDRRLFEPPLGPNSAARILRLKRDDPEETELELFNDLNGVASRRLGQILGHNTHLTSLGFGSNFDVAGLCAGLQTNRSIRLFELDEIDLSGVVKMNSLVPFLANHPSLEEICLSNCNIGPDGIENFSDALSGRRTGTLSDLDLTGNNFGNVNLDRLIRALMPEKSKELIELNLTECGIGLQGCASLATLLQENSSRGLKVLNLYANAIDDDSARVLAGSLVENSRLMELVLSGNDGITRQGWKAILDLIYDTRSMEHMSASNHTLRNLGAFTPFYTQRLSNALGVDDANLLWASLKLNYNDDKMIVIKHKLIWSHAQGRLNIGDSPLVAGVMPQILACFSTFSNETDSEFIRQHEPPLPELRITTMGLDAVFRILRSRPDLCQTESDPPRSVRRRRRSRGADAGAGRRRIL